MVNLQKIQNWEAVKIDRNLFNLFTVFRLIQEYIQTPASNVEAKNQIWGRVCGIVNKTELSCKSDFDIFLNIKKIQNRRKQENKSIESIIERCKAAAFEREEKLKIIINEPANDKKAA